jgi:hypothetical protein
MGWVGALHEAALRRVALPAGAILPPRMADASSLVGTAADLARAQASAVPQWRVPAGSSFSSHALFEQGDPVGDLDIWISTGDHEGFGGASLDEYFSCNSQEDRNCEIWRVRWSFLKQEAVEVERVRAGDDVIPAELGDFASYHKAALDPEGEAMAYALTWGAGTGDRWDVFVAPNDPSADPREDLHADKEYAGSPEWLSSVSFPNWYDHKTLIGTAGGNIYPFPGIKDKWLDTGSIWRADVAWSWNTVTDVTGFEAVVGPWTDLTNYPLDAPTYGDPETHPAVQYGYLQSPSVGGSVALTTATTTEPRVTSQGKPYYVTVPGGDWATAHIVDLDDPSHVEEYDLDVGVWEPTTPARLALYADPAAILGGVHHTSWNLSGTRVSGSHQHTVDWYVDQTDARFRKMLHGFRFPVAASYPLLASGLWSPDGYAQATRGYLFEPPWPWDFEAQFPYMPSALPSPYPTAIDPGKVVCEGFHYKYTEWCGHDDYIVVNAFGTNEAYASEEWTDPVALDDIGHLDSFVSRVFLVRLSTGEHWDLGAAVEQYRWSVLGERVQVGDMHACYATCGSPYAAAATFDTLVPGAAIHVLVGLPVEPFVTVRGGMVASGLRSSVNLDASVAYRNA